MPSTAAMWQSLAGTMFADITDEFLGAFRRPGGANRRLGSWDPVDTGTRYFKTLLYNAAAAQPPAFFRAWPKLGRTDLGDPLHVTVGACRIDLDYLLAVQEVLFVGQSMDAGDCRHIVEIGAGFGRTCHAFLALWETVESYTIIDLPPLLNLSRAYLGKVLPPSDLTRVRFIATESPQWRAMASDLVINIDSMQEMPKRPSRPISPT